MPFLMVRLRVCWRSHDFALPCGTYMEWYMLYSLAVMARRGWTRCAHRYFVRPRRARAFVPASDSPRVQQTHEGRDTSKYSQALSAKETGRLGLFVDTYVCMYPTGDNRSDLQRLESDGV